MINPSEEFVRLVSSELLGSKQFRPTVRDQFTLIIKRAFEQLVGERINEPLKGAMTSELTPIAATDAPVILGGSAAEPQIVTSVEELEGFHSVRSILRGPVSPKRVVMRDAQGYCAVLLDDNNRKPICRLRFNNVEKLRLSLFNDKKEEVHVQLDSLDDIFNHADQLKATLAAYNPNEGASTKK
jgi:predicted type IV restriction endonuclease